MARSDYSLQITDPNHNYYTYPEYIYDTQDTVVTFRAVLKIVSTVGESEYTYPEAYTVGVFPGNQTPVVVTNLPFYVSLGAVTWTVSDPAHVQIMSQDASSITLRGINTAGIAFQMPLGTITASITVDGTLYTASDN